MIYYLRIKNNKFFLNPYIVKILISIFLILIGDFYNYLDLVFLIAITASFIIFITIDFLIYSERTKYSMFLVLKSFLFFSISFISFYYFLTSSGLNDKYFILICCFIACFDALDSNHKYVETSGLYLFLALCFVNSIDYIPLDNIKSLSTIFLISFLFLFFFINVLPWGEADAVITFSLCYLLISNNIIASILSIFLFLFLVVLIGYLILRNNKNEKSFVPYITTIFLISKYFSINLFS